MQGLENLLSEVPQPSYMGKSTGFMKRRWRAFFPVMLATAAVACGKESPSPPIAKQAEIETAPVPKSVFTKDQWRVAFSSSFETSKTKSGEDGVTTYSACFQKEKGDKCSLFAQGRHDGFRKLDHLIPPGTAWRQSMGDLSGPFLGIYIAAPECSAPSILLAPVVTGENWLFMNKVALMADGEVVLERTFSEVERDHNANRIVERAAFVATNEEINALKKFASAKTAIIRIGGKNGYVTGDTLALTLDVGIVFRIVKKLEAAFDSMSGPNCLPS